MKDVGCGFVGSFRQHENKVEKHVSLVEDLISVESLVYQFLCPCVYFTRWVELCPQAPLLPCTVLAGRAV